MVLAISLVNVVPDQENIVHDALKNVEGIKDLYHAIGDRNLFLILEAGNMDGVNRILNQIKKVSPSGAVRMIGCRQLGIS
jgi:DNA-binding Lrp family transcriptional regulator